MTRTDAETTAAGQHPRPLARATLPKEIVAAIATLIMQRVWKPGDRIPSEKELAVRFAVGRSTIREAVRSLAILGVIDARPGDGSYIREPTSDLLSGAFQWGALLTERNLGDLVDVRVLIEVECAGRAAASRDASVAAALLALNDRMSQEKKRPEEFMPLDNQFHKTIAAAAGNALFLSLSSTIQSLVAVWYARTYEIERTDIETIKEHHAIAKAIEAHDEAGARAAMKQHVLRAASRLHKVLDPASGG